MMSIMPPHITSDAVPDKRTDDENHQPPTTEEAVESERRHTETTPEVVDEARGGGNSGTSQTASSSDKPNKPTGTNTKEKPQRKKKSSSGSSIVNISNCSGFQLCNNSYISNNFMMNGVLNKRNSSSSTQGPKASSKGQARKPIPEGVWGCLEKVTEEDCTIVSEYVSCTWKTLGKELFKDNLEDFEEYKDYFKVKPSKEAVLLVLIKWKQINWRLADVRELSLALEKLNETEAILKIAKTHGIKS